MAGATPPRVLLDARGFSKTFAATTVLSGVNLTVRAGEVKALLGQNGSGKSTFIKVLCGFHEPDPGARLMLRGTGIGLPVSSTEAAASGLSVMHQDLGLEPTLSVTDNFMLGAPNWRASLRPIKWRKVHKSVRQALREFDLDLDVSTPVSRLSGPERAVVALVRALDALGDEEPGILVLDEPTASLEREAVEALFDAVRAARNRGCAVLFVSHNLAEVARLCDSVAVLRDGRLVAEGPMSSFSESALIGAIVGREISELYPAPVPSRSRPVALSARGLCGDVLVDVSFELHEGEVLGVTGLAGMGQDELPMLLYGAVECRRGEVELSGRPLKLDPRAALKAGMALVPADRKSLGGDAAATVEHNLTLPVVGRYARRGRLDQQSERRDVLDLLRSYDVRPADPLRKLGELSGGNQQKAILGKWISLYGRANVLLLHEPTQGVDVGARQEIFQFIRDAADRGTAVLYVSTEHEDLANVCDRVLVMREGRLTGELAKPLDATSIAAFSLSTS